MGNANLCVPKKPAVDEKKGPAVEKPNMVQESKDVDSEEEEGQQMTEKEMLDHITELALTEARQVIN